MKAYCILNNAIIVEADNHTNVEISATMLVIASRGARAFMAAVLTKEQAEKIVLALCAAHGIQHSNCIGSHPATSD